MLDPPQLVHEFMHTHIHMHADSCEYLFILYTLTCRQLLNRVMPKDGLRRKQKCLYMRENVLHSSNFLKDIL